MDDLSIIKWLYNLKNLNLFSKKFNRYTEVTLANKVVMVSSVHAVLQRIVCILHCALTTQSQVLKYQHHLCLKHYFSEFVSERLGT